jgi:hypothetical protein
VKAWRDEDAIEVLACEIETRPPAPGPEALAPFIQSASHSPTAITIDLDEAGRQTAEAFVAAERVCCSNIGWQLKDAPRFRLRITAEPHQLVALRALILTTVQIEEVQ